MRHLRGRIVDLASIAVSGRSECIKNSGFGREKKIYNRFRNLDDSPGPLFLIKVATRVQQSNQRSDVASLNTIAQS